MQMVHTAVWVEGGDKVQPVKTAAIKKVINRMPNNMPISQDSLSLSPLKF